MDSETRKRRRRWIGNGMTRIVTPGVLNRFGDTTKGAAYPAGQTLVQSPKFRQTAPEIRDCPGFAARLRDGTVSPERICHEPKALCRATLRPGLRGLGDGPNSRLPPDRGTAQRRSGVRGRRHGTTLWPEGVHVARHAPLG